MQRDTNPLELSYKPIKSKNTTTESNSRAKELDYNQMRKRSIQNELRNWEPKTVLGQKVKQGHFLSLYEALKDGPIKEPQIVDFLQKDLKIQKVDVARVSHTLKSGKQYLYRVVVLVGNSNGYIGCGVGKSKILANALKTGIFTAKKNILHVGILKKYDYSEFYTPITVTSSKKGSTSVVVQPLPGYSVTASKLGRKYCQLCNLKGLKISTGNKGRASKGMVNSPLNYYTALHEAVTRQLKYVSK